MGDVVLWLSDAPRYMIEPTFDRRYHDCYWRVMEVLWSMILNLVRIPLIAVVAVVSMTISFPPSLLSLKRHFQVRTVRAALVILTYLLQSTPPPSVIFAVIMIADIFALADIAYLTLVAASSPADSDYSDSAADTVAFVIVADS